MEKAFDRLLSGIQNQKSGTLYLSNSFITDENISAVIDDYKLFISSSLVHKRPDVVVLNHNKLTKRGLYDLFADNAFGAISFKLVDNPVTIKEIHDLLVTNGQRFTIWVTICGFLCEFYSRHQPLDSIEIHDQLWNANSNFFSSIPPFVKYCKLNMKVGDAEEIRDSFFDFVKQLVRLDVSFKNLHKKSHQTNMFNLVIEACARNKNLKTLNLSKFSGCLGHVDNKILLEFFKQTCVKNFQIDDSFNSFILNEYLLQNRSIIHPLFYQTIRGKKTALTIINAHIEHNRKNFGLFIRKLALFLHKHKQLGLSKDVARTIVKLSFKWPEYLYIFQ